jgi:hypothetical protein
MKSPFVHEEYYREMLARVQRLWFDANQGMEMDFEVAAPEPEGSEDVVRVSRCAVILDKWIPDLTQDEFVRYIKLKYRRIH